MDGWMDGWIDTYLEKENYVCVYLWFDLVDMYLKFGIRFYKKFS